MLRPPGNLDGSCCQARPAPILGSTGAESSSPESRASLSGLPDPGLRSAQQGEGRSALACLEPVSGGSRGCFPAQTARLEVKRPLGAGLVQRVKRYHMLSFTMIGALGGVRKGGRRGCRHQGWLHACLVETAWQLHEVKAGSLHPESNGLCTRRAAACPSDDL